MRKISKMGFRLICLCSFALGGFAQTKPAMLKIAFQYSANGKALQLRDSGYVNSFKEDYKINRLKFYLSNVTLLPGSTKESRQQNVFLIDANSPDTLMLPIATGQYHKLGFTVGVDSLQNVNGAQDGALDPLNGMYWTWHSGYIFFKLEGSSSASSADLKRIEHHVGGYSGLHKAQRIVALPLPRPLSVKPGDTYQMAIEVNLDKYWLSAHHIKIAERPLIMTPGETSAKSADNIFQMFSILSLQP